MDYIILTLVYVIGAAGTIHHAVVVDAQLRTRVALKVDYRRLPTPPKFSGYLFWYGLLWPLTIWWVLYGIWQEYTGR